MLLVSTVPNSLDISAKIPPVNAKQVIHAIRFIPSIKAKIQSPGVNIPEQIIVAAPAIKRAIWIFPPMTGSLFINTMPSSKTIAITTFDILVPPMILFKKHSI